MYITPPYCVQFSTTLRCSSPTRGLTVWWRQAVKAGQERTGGKGFKDWRKRSTYIVLPLVCMCTAQYSPTLRCSSPASRLTVQWRQAVRAGQERTRKGLRDWRMRSIVLPLVCMRSMYSPTLRCSSPARGLTVWWRQAMKAGQERTGKGLRD